MKAGKENFSGPAYVIHAATIAAGVPDRDFSPWLVSAIEAKLRRENPGLLEKTHESMRLAMPMPAQIGESISATQKTDASEFISNSVKARSIYSTAKTTGVSEKP